MMADLAQQAYYLAALLGCAFCLVGTIVTITAATIERNEKG